MLSARGRNLLFADADGATKFSDFDKLAEALSTISTDWKQEAIVIGSRAHLEQDSIATRSAFRFVICFYKKNKNIKIQLIILEHS